MLIYNKLPQEVIVEQVTVDNLEEVATWCGGHVKGTSLSPIDRVIEFWNDGEHEANVGDYITYNTVTKEYNVYTKEKFYRTHRLTAVR